MYYANHFAVETHSMKRFQVETFRVISFRGHHSRFPKENMGRMQSVDVQTSRISPAANTGDVSAEYNGKCSRPHAVDRAFRSALLPID